MQKPAEELSALFRSLGPDDSGFQATETAAAREAEQRWPLFRAVSPKKALTTPALSPQERQCWSQDESAAGSERKPALSLPGLNDKMAMSLGKMSGRTSDMPMRNLAQRSEPSPMPVTPPVSDHVDQQKTTISARNELFSSPQSVDQAVVREVPVQAHAPVPAQVSGLGLFSALEDDAQAAIPAASETEHADDSLAKVFSRLEGKPETVHRPSDKKSSFLSRLGNR